MNPTLALIFLIVSSASFAKRTIRSYDNNIKKHKKYARTVRSSSRRTQEFKKAQEELKKAQELNYESQFDTSKQKLSEPLPNTETDTPASTPDSTTNTSTEMTNEVSTQSVSESFHIFSEVDLAWRNLNESGETISNSLSGSILIGYQFPTLFGLEGFEISMRYQPSNLNLDAVTSNSQTLLAGIGYEYGLMNNLGLLARLELGAELPQTIESSSGSTPQKFLEPGFSSQVGVGLRYYINMIDFNKQLAVGFNVYSNMGSFIGVTLGPSVSLFI